MRLLSVLSVLSGLAGVFFLLATAVGALSALEGSSSATGWGEVALCAFGALILCVLSTAMHRVSKDADRK